MKENLFPTHQCASRFIGCLYLYTERGLYSCFIRKKERAIAFLVSSWCSVHCVFILIFRVGFYLSLFSWFYFLFFRVRSFILHYKASPASPSRCVFDVTHCHANVSDEIERCDIIGSGGRKKRRKTLGASSGPGQREWAITASASRWFDPNVSLMTRLLDQSGTWGFYIGTSSQLTCFARYIYC